MSQIQEAFREFIESRNDPFGDTDRKLDSDAITIVHDCAQPIDDRIGTLRTWWHGYSVARNLRTGEHAAVAKAFIEHFDVRTKDRLKGNTEIVREFDSLAKLAKECRLPEFKDGKLTSLCSKTLWLFYPDDAPMYDGYAESALRVLSRLYKYSVDKEAPEFAQFVQAWTQGFSHIENVIPESALWPHKVRTFDAFLWWLGKGTFETFES